MPCFLRAIEECDGLPEDPKRLFECITVFVLDKYLTMNNQNRNVDADGRPLQDESNLSLELK